MSVMCTEFYNIGACLNLTVSAVKRFFSYKISTNPEPLDFHGVDTGVCGGVRIDALLEKLSREEVMETSMFPPPRTDIADSRIFYDGVNVINKHSYFLTD